MLGILLGTNIPMRILSIVGIVLLAVLGLLLTALLLFAFFPFTYRVSGSKDAQGLRLAVRVNWLFGLFRVRFRYPEPGRLTARVLWFTVFDCKIPPKTGEGGKECEPHSGTGKEKTEKKAEAEKHGGAERDRKGDGGRQGTSDSADQAEASKGAGARADAPDSAESGTSERAGKFFRKLQKIKYTICSIYDKIKEIWKNISYYIELLQEENTKQLAAHAVQRGRKVLKSVRPKHVRAELVFGTGSPDTTGYLYGGYCMAASLFGTGFWVAPDFEQKRFEGEFEVSGHVILWVLAINGLKLLFDRKLRVFLRRLKDAQKKASA